MMSNIMTPMERIARAELLLFVLSQSVVLTPEIVEERRELQSEIKHQKRALEAIQ